jgi:hypothetical protein
MWCCACLSRVGLSRAKQRRSPLTEYCRAIANFRTLFKRELKSFGRQFPRAESLTERIISTGRVCFQPALAARLTRRMSHLTRSNF